MFVKGGGCRFGGRGSGVVRVIRPGLLLGCGQDRDGPLEWSVQALIRSRPAGLVVPGDGRRIVSRPARMRQPIRGSGRPRIGTSAGGAEVGVDLAGDVS